MTGSIEIRDPQVKGTVTYDVPWDQMLTTSGLQEYVASPEGGFTRQRCLCRLWMEGSCLQDTNCKSFHVNKDYVAQQRRLRGVEYDTSFLSEVMVQTVDNDVFVVRYNAVAKTQGLEVYRKEVRNGVAYGTVCPMYEDCPNGKGCPNIHLKNGELKEYFEGRQRTPCCIMHGDRHTQASRRVCETIKVVEQGRRHHELTNCQLAPTAGLTRIRSQTITHTDLCGMHVKSRCKFGRSCTKVHVCREWAERHQVKVTLPERVERTRRSDDFSTTSSQSTTPRSTADPQPTMSPPPLSQNTITSTPTVTPITPITIPFLKDAAPFLRFAPSAIPTQSPNPFPPSLLNPLPSGDGFDNVLPPLLDGDDLDLGGDFPTDESWAPDHDVTSFCSGLL